MDLTRLGMEHAERAAAPLLPLVGLCHTWVWADSLRRLDPPRCVSAKTAGIFSRTLDAMICPAGKSENKDDCRNGCAKSRMYKSFWHNRLQCQSYQTLICPAGKSENKDDCRNGCAKSRMYKSFWHNRLQCQSYQTL